MSDLSVRFPFDSADKETQVKLKPFFKTSSPITEVSFPNSRVKVLKIVCHDFTLFVGRINAKDKPAFIELGKTLADIFKDIQKGEVKQVPKMAVKLDKDKIAIIEFDWEDLITFKKKADGWFQEWSEEEFIDFFA